MGRNTSAESRIKDIAITDIDRSGNHRIAMPGDAERIDALKKSIEACGQLQPIRVYERGDDQRHGKHDKPYILGFGNRRCAAMESLGKGTIRAVVFPPASNAEIAQARAVENLHRQDITPLEEVRAVADVLEAIKAEPTFTGDLHEEAATRLARSVAWVKDRDYLHRLAKPVQAFVMQSGLPAGHLRELAKIGDADEQLRLACESAGAPAWTFINGDKGAAERHRDIREGYFAEVADGKVNRWPLSRLKGEIAKVRLSLRLTPWEFDKAISLGDVKLRRCNGCPHNSETDRTLFEIEEDAENPKGFCLNPTCYNAKHEACQKAKEQTLAKISKRTVKTPEAIRKAAPDWIKESTVVGYVKRQLEKTANSGSTKGNDKPSKSPRNYGGRELTDHEKALRTFATAFDDWEESAYTAIIDSINADLTRRVSWCVLLGVPAMWDHQRIDVPHVSEYSQPAKEGATIPPPPQDLLDAVHLVFKGTRVAWMDVLSRHQPIDPTQHRAIRIPNPHVLIAIAEEIDVELPAMPAPVEAIAAMPGDAAESVQQDEELNNDADTEEAGEPIESA